METTTPIGTDQDWAAREKEWRKRLRRIRFGVESVDVQVQKLRRVTVALTVVAAIVATMFLAIFLAFRRPDIGLVVIAVIFGPIVGLAWREQKRLEAGVQDYLAEKKARE